MLPPETENTNALRRDSEMVVSIFQSGGNSAPATEK